LGGANWWISVEDPPDELAELPDGAKQPRLSGSSAHDLHGKT